MSLRLELGEGIEQRFRKAAMESYGYGKGALKKAAVDAFELWLSMENPNMVKKVDDPVKLIEGIFSHLKGKTTSVELQHEATRLWAKKQ